MGRLHGLVWQRLTKALIVTNWFMIMTYFLSECAERGARAREGSD